jgi:hypothetical protein
MTPQTDSLTIRCDRAWLCCRPPLLRPRIAFDGHLHIPVCVSPGAVHELQAGRRCGTGVARSTSRPGGGLYRLTVSAREKRPRVPAVDIVRPALISRPMTSGGKGIALQEFCRPRPRMSRG